MRAIRCVAGLAKASSLRCGPRLAAHPARPSRGPWGNFDSLPAFIGDIDLSGFGPYYGDATSSLGEFRRSLAALPGLDARIWVTSHHRAVITDRAKFLADLAAFARRIDERSDRLLDYLRGGPQTIDALAGRRILYPPEHDALWVECAERRTIAMHLDELIAAGQVRREGALYELARAMPCGIASARQCAMTDARPPLPDRLSTDPASPHHVAAVFEHPIGIRLDGRERHDVEEYCVSEGWVKVPAGKTRDRKGRPLLLTLKGRVEAYYR